MSIVDIYGIFGIYSSGGKSRQKARILPNGDYWGTPAPLLSWPALVLVLKHVLFIFYSFSAFSGNKTFNQHLGQNFQTFTNEKNESRLIFKGPEKIYIVQHFQFTSINFDGPRPVKNGSISGFCSGSRLTLCFALWNCSCKVNYSPICGKMYNTYYLYLVLRGNSFVPVLKHVSNYLLIYTRGRGCSCHRKWGNGLHRRRNFNNRIFSIFAVGSSGSAGCYNPAGRRARPVIYCDVMRSSGPVDPQLVAHRLPGPRWGLRELKQITEPYWRKWFYTL